ncbi:MAG: hypothetical protein U0792_08870 [Gemmataceae bacterium]
MTTDENLIGFLLNVLDAEETAAVATQVREDSGVAARLEQLRLSLIPFEADRESAVEPPPGLALRTIARLAAHLASHEPPQSQESDHGTLLAVAKQMEVHYPEPHPLAFPTVPSESLRRPPREEAETKVVGGRFRLDLLVACGIALFATGLVFSAIGKVRAQNQVLACQENLRTLHTGLAGYADIHNGAYPQIGNGTLPTAETFVTALADAGQVPVTFRPCCPADPSVNAAPVPSMPVGYTYSLGYRTRDGDLVGFHRTAGNGEHDLVPISADYPTRTVAPVSGPVCPHPVGMNVLCAGGSVRHTTTPLIGPNGDDIYRNIFGRVGAGANANDIVLGRPGDRP